MNITACPAQTDKARFQMTEKKNKLLALLVLCVLLLSSCFSDGGDNGDSGAYSCASAHDGEALSADGSSDDTGSVALTQAQKEILSLVEADSRIISLFLLGGAAPDVPADYSYYPLPESSGYRSYDAFSALLHSVYSPDCDVIDRLLTYPTAAGTIIKSDGGNTVICKTYLPDYDLVPDTANAQFAENDASHARLTVPASDGREYTFTAVKQDGEWFLESSLFLLWLDGASAVKWEDSGLKPGQNEGSAKRLTGKCLVINLFIDDAVSSWSDADTENALAMVNAGADFISAQAEAYGAKLSLDVTDKHSSVYIKTSRSITTSIDDYLWIELLFADTTYRTLEGCASSYFDLDDYDNWCVMLHINKKGRSYALACNSTYYDYNIYTSERAVMFYSADSGYAYRSVAATYAHELLHLFGAVDLYDECLGSDASEALRHFYPNAIMSVVGNDLDMSGICPYTAYLIGWADSIPKPFDRLLNTAD